MTDCHLPARCRATDRCPSLARFRLVPVGAPDWETCVCGNHLSTTAVALLALPGVTRVQLSKGVVW